MGKMWILVIANIFLHTGQILSSCDQCKPYHSKYDRWGYYCNNGHSLINYWCYPPCPLGCEACKRPYSCGNCNDGYYLYNRMCQACRHNCKTCTQLNWCNTCNDGYYLDNYMCHACRHNCKTCTFESKSSCVTCKEGYYGYGCMAPCSVGCYNRTCEKTSGNCHDGCMNGYYGLKCQQECTQHCATCTDGNTCMNCETGYYGPSCELNCSTRCLNDCSKDDGECSACVNGYYKNGKECEVCSKGCVKCHGNDLCSECQNGYFLELDTNICSVCGQHCSRCSSKDNCSTCDDGHAIVNGVCISFHNSLPSKTSSSVLAIVTSTFGGIVVMVTVVIVGIILWRRRDNRPDFKAGGGRPSGIRDPRTGNEILNPAYMYNDIDIDPATESELQNTSPGTDAASTDHVYAVVQKKSKQKPGQPHTTRFQDDGADNVYDVTSSGRLHGRATNIDKSRSEAEGDTYSHIDHTSGLRQHRHDNENTYDHVTRHNLQKGDVDDTYDVTGGQTSRIYDHTVKATANTADTSVDEYSTIRNVR